MEDEDMFQQIKKQTMEEYGYNEEDMDDGGVEDEVNSTSREIFKFITGREYED